jgi:hypothetical protein
MKARCKKNLYVVEHDEAKRTDYCFADIADASQKSDANTHA